MEVGKRGIWSPARVAQERPDAVYHLVAIDFWRPATVAASLSSLSTKFAQGACFPSASLLFVCPVRASLPSAILLRVHVPYQAACEAVAHRCVADRLHMHRSASGAFDPLPLLCYSFSSAADGLRQLAAAQHIGKVVVAAPAPAPRKLLGRWLVLGGLGALGLLSARWLASQGGYPINTVDRWSPSTRKQDDQSW